MTKRALIQAKFDNKCAYCGRKLNYKEVTIDHVIPKCKGGTKNEENLYPACWTCNKTKADLSIDEFRKRVGGREFYFEWKKKLERYIVEAIRRLEN